MTRVVLLRPHTHAGKLYGVRDRIEVDSATADWLIRQGVAAFDPAPATALPESKPNHRKEPKP